MSLPKAYNDIPKHLEVKASKLLSLARTHLKGQLIEPYQPKGVKYMIQKELTGPGCILADEMGLGKTVMTVSFLLAMKEHTKLEQRPMLPTLVIAPKSVCQQWVDEIAKFSDLNAVLYDRSIDSNLNDYDVVVVSFSFFTRGTCTETSIYKNKFQRVILDEAHWIKNPNTVTSKHIKEIKCEKKLCLSGTPIQNDPKDLFSLVKWIFKDDIHKLHQATRGVSLASKSKEKRQMCMDFIRNCILMRRTLDDVSVFNKSLSLPTLDVRIVSIPFKSSDEHALYCHVQDLARERIQNVLKSSAYSTQSNMDILEALLRCRQVCIHPALFVDALYENPKVAFKWGRVKDSPSNVSLLLTEKQNTLNMPSTKLETLVSLILSQPPEDKTLIFSSFVREMRIIKHLLQKAGVQLCLLYHGDMSSQEREHVLDKFKTSTYKHSVLVIQMNAGGTGLNLQVANRCYVTSPAYNPSLEMQCIARSHRTGQTKPVTCVRLVMQDSVEEKILDIQHKKLQMISKAFDDQRILKKLSKQSFNLSKQELASLFDITISASGSSSNEEDSDTDPNDSLQESTVYTSSDSSSDDDMVADQECAQESAVCSMFTMREYQSSKCIHISDKTTVKDIFSEPNAPTQVHQPVPKKENNIYNYDISVFDDL